MLLYLWKSLLLLCILVCVEFFSFLKCILVYLKVSALQVWFMAEFSHIFSDFDEVSPSTLLCHSQFLIDMLKMLGNI